MTSQVSIINSGLFALGRVRFTTESVEGFGLNLSGSSQATFRDLLTTEASGKVLIEPLKNEAMKQRIDDMERTINGRRRCDMSFTTWLNGSGLATAYGTTGSMVNNNILLKAVMGGGGAATQTNKVAATGSAGHFTVAISASFASFPGCAYGVLNSDGFLETARIRRATDATGDIYLAHSFSFTPAFDQQLQGSQCNFLTQDTLTTITDPTNTTGSLQFQVQRAGTTDNFVFMGLNGGFTIKTELGQLPSISYKLDGGADWITGSQIDTLDVADYSTESEPPKFVNGSFNFYPLSNDPTSVAPNSVIDIFSIEITPNITYAPIPSERGVNNILRQRRQRSVPIATGKFVTYMNDQTYYDAWNNRTLYGAELQIGNTIGNTVMISCPRVQITSVASTDAGGMDGQEVTFECYEDTGAILTDAFPDAYFPITDLARSALSLYFF